MSDYAELGADDKYVQAFLDGAANPSRFKFFHKATDVTHHIRIQAPDGDYNGAATDVVLAFAIAAGEYAGQDGFTKFSRFLML